MKVSAYSLGGLSLLFTFILCGNCMAQDVPMKKQDLKTKAKITAFFSDYLSGKDGGFLKARQQSNPPTRRKCRLSCGRLGKK